MIRNAALCLSLVALSACSSDAMSDAMSTWEGVPIEQAIDQWGVPHEEHNVAGYTGYLWHRERDMLITTPSTSVGTIGSTQVTALSTTTNTVHSSCTRHLYYDEKGIITKTQWSGNDCCVMTVSGWCAGIQKAP
jgi:hypothetical protein